MKIRPVGANLFHADGCTHRQTHMTKVTVAFRNSANAPNKRGDNFPFSLLSNAYCNLRISMTIWTITVAKN